MGNFRRAITSPAVSIALQVLLIVILLLFVIGIIGYQALFDMDLSNASYTTVLTLANATTTSAIAVTKGQQFFVSFYALAANLFLVAMVSSIVALAFGKYIEEVQNSREDDQ